jgi:hypothetical protein
MRTTMFNQRKMRRPSLALAFIGALASIQPAKASELFLIPDKSVVSIQSQPLIRLVGDAFVKGDAPIEQSSPAERDRRRERSAQRCSPRCVV